VRWTRDESLSRPRLLHTMLAATIPATTVSVFALEGAEKMLPSAQRPSCPVRQCSTAESHHPVSTMLAAAELHTTTSPVRGLSALSLSFLLFVY
jgi:hypothetical protein